MSNLDDLPSELQKLVEERIKDSVSQFCLYQVNDEDIKMRSNGAIYIDCHLDVHGETRRTIKWLVPISRDGYERIHETFDVDLAIHFLRKYKLTHDAETKSWIQKNKLT